jgi:hypothetical protein
MQFGITKHIATLAVELIVLSLSTPTFAADTENQLDPDALLLQIRNKMAERLSRLPNYTCLEVVDRWTRSAGGLGLNPVDRVEFEVAFVGSREYFAPRGGTQFDGQSIMKMVPVGTIGNGAFGAHVSALFNTDSPTFKYVGPSKKDGHKTFRYDFEVPQEKSSFLVKGSGQGVVGFKGSFWVDAQTVDLVRLELIADHMPPYIGVRSVMESMQYSMVQIRGSEFLLASKSEMTAVDDRGNYSLNMVRLQNCREFRGESVVTYGTPTDDNSADRRAPPNQ